jgi:electron transfer flavoprotein beta subunit
MNIVVCISKTPDTTAKISFRENDTQFNPDGVSFIMNPYDEWYALVKGIELVEKYGDKVTAINVGPASNEIIIRKALAIGADEAVRVDTDPTDARMVAENIAAYIHSNSIDLVLLGKETIDYNGSEVGAMVAELLDCPYVSLATSLERNNETYRITREIEGGTETCEVDGLVVVSAAKGMAEQRIPNMKGIMMAKNKPLHVIPPISETREMVAAKKFQLPAGKTGVKLVDPLQMDELVRLLHEEAKVI